MTNQPSEQQPTRPLVFPLGGQREIGGDHVVQAIFLRRQVSELERRLDALGASERKVRDDLLAAIGSSQMSTREQARLHEELAEGARAVSQAVTREATLHAELASLRFKLRLLEADLSAAQTQTARLPAVELALNEALAEAERANVRLAKVTDYARQRARIFGHLAEQIRQDRNRQLILRAALDASTGSATTLLEQKLAAQQTVNHRLRERTAASDEALVNAALAARANAQQAEQKLRNERWQLWLSTTQPQRRAPKRRSRATRLLEKILSRLGPLGGAAALERSGLWSGEFQTDNRPSARRTTALAYVRARGTADTPVKALFDQHYYLEKNPSVAALGQAPLLHYLVHGDRENRWPHPLVDVAYYRKTNPHEIGSTSLTVLQHFLFIGAAKGLNPHPLFDVRFYVSQLSDQNDLAVNPLVHYLRTGWRRGLNPHPLFDNDRYLAQYPEVADMMIAPLLHYVTLGAKEGRDPHALFFGHWYQAAYPDVLTSGQIPLTHFIQRGLTERRNPNPFFDADHYLHNAFDAYSAGHDPLRHYIEVGAARGISPNRDFDCASFLAANPAAITGAGTPLEAWINAGCPPTASSHTSEPESASEIAVSVEDHRPLLEQLFDIAYYREQTLNLLPSDQSPLDHYLSGGWRLGLNPHRLFDTAWYIARHPEALDAGAPPLLHFAINGARELHDPHPLFDSRWYIERYPDVGASGEIPLVHFLRTGAAEGRSPGPLFDAEVYRKTYPDIVEAGVQNALLHFLVHWPLDHRSKAFDSPAAEAPQGVDIAEWVAGMADSLVEISRSLPRRYAP